MKLKATLPDSENGPTEMNKAFRSRDWTVRALAIVGGIFGIPDIMRRPSEYFVQKPDEMVNLVDGEWGVDLRLSNVSRLMREPKLFHDVTRGLFDLAVETIKRTVLVGQRVQLHFTLMLNGDIPALPNTGGAYSNQIEYGAVWVDGELDPTLSEDTVPEFAL